MKKIFAFTLAETLIVMGVIGVVAALTLPNLNQSTGNKEKVAKLKKIQQNLEDAYGRATAIYGPRQTWKSGGKHVANRLSDFLKYSKMCTVSNTSCAMPKNNGTSSFGSQSSDGSNSFVLADGALIHIHDTMTIWVDLDGNNKGKNQVCHDIFKFYHSDNEGVYPAGQGAADNTSVTEDNCTAWVIQYDNMDYLKCNDLKFGGKTTCK